MKLMSFQITSFLQILILIVNIMWHPTFKKKENLLWHLVVQKFRLYELPDQARSKREPFGVPKSHDRSWSSSVFRWRCWDRNRDWFVLIFRLLAGLFPWKCRLTLWTVSPVRISLSEAWLLPGTRRFPDKWTFICLICEARPCQTTARLKSIAMVRYTLRWNQRFREVKSLENWLGFSPDQLDYYLRKPVGRTIFVRFNEGWALISWKIGLEPSSYVTPILNACDLIHHDLYGKNQVSGRMSFS